MKKALFLILITVLVGCSQSENDPNNNNNDNASPANTSNNEEEQATSDVSIRFSEVEVIAQNKNLSVAGEVKTNADVFYYTLEQGEDVIIEETAIELDGDESEWQTFEIDDDSLNIEKENEEAPYLTFYAKDNDRIINPNYVPIDLLLY